jgi:hypothetical protein
MNTGRRQTFRLARYRARTEYRFTSTRSSFREQDPAEYCRDLIRTRDYESFLTSHFYPKNLQNAYLALRAFYVCVWHIYPPYFTDEQAGRARNHSRYSIPDHDRENACAVLERCCQRYRLRSYSSPFNSTSVFLMTSSTRVDLQNILWPSLSIKYLII